MSLYFIADCHIGNRKRFGPVEAGFNQMGRWTVAAFAKAVRHLKKDDWLFVAGDLFHSRFPEPAMMTAVLDLVQEAVTGAGAHVVIVPGNHDLIDVAASTGNTACSPLHAFATVPHTPVFLSDEDWSVFCVPFTAAAPMAEFLVSVPHRSKHSSGHKLLVTHIGVYDDNDPPWMAQASDAIHADRLLDLLENRDYDAAFVGNFHKGKMWQRETDGPVIVQCGALCPSSFSDMGVFPEVGALTEYSNGTIYQHEIQGPRFVTKEQGVEGVLVGKDKDMLFVHEEKEQSAEAPVNLPLAEDYTDAVYNFIEAMATPEGVTKEAVRNAVQDCWRRA